MNVIEILKNSIDTVILWNKKFDEMGLTDEQKKKVGDMILDYSKEKIDKKFELQTKINNAIEYMEQDRGNGDFIELIKILKGE